jgi:uncharacterized protein (TIGR01619 family)
MADNWDFFLCRVNDKPASIMVNLALVDEAPIERLPYMAYVEVRLKSPDPNGLSSGKESTMLASIEDSLAANLSDEETAMYVGRNTSDGRRDFFFYIAHPTAWENRVRQAMQSFQDYDFAAGVRNEATWQTYFEFLYPSEIDRLCIENRRVCQTLKQNGDALTQEREIDHFAQFPDAASRSRFVDEALKLGFAARATTDPETPDGGFSIHLVRADIPDYANIDAITEPLFGLAKEFGGSYDGWGCPIVR